MRSLANPQNVPISGTPRRRLIKLCLTIAGIGAAGLLYALFVSVTGIGIPCVFRLVTGLKCPGCGVSRMCMALLHLDFKTAWHSNPAVMAMLPLGTAVALDVCVRYVRTGRVATGRASGVAVIFMIAVLVVFGVLRNIV